MNRVIAVVLAVIAGLSIATQAKGIGPFSAFKNGIGARALAMGGAFVAVADDANAPQWNPAGVAQLSGTRLAGTSSGLGGIGVASQYVGAVRSFGSFGIGLGWGHVFFGDDLVGALGESLPRVGQAIVGSLAMNVGVYALAGANVKYYTSEGGPGVGASGYGIDTGLLLSVDDRLSIGISAIDLVGSAQARDSGTSDVVPSSYRAGWAVKLSDERITLATDIVFDGEELGDAHVGVEFQVIDQLALRGGVVLTDNFQDQYFAVGAGIKIEGLYVDAAYIAQGELGDTLIISVESNLPFSGLSHEEETENLDEEQPE